jgi:hypothetical protein
MHRTMSVSKSDHASLPWRIHAIANDFRVEDVWALPTPGGANDFPRLVALLQSFDSRRSAPVVRALFAIRWKLGAWLGLDGDGTGIGSRVASLRERLPTDLADTARDDQSAGPFTTLYVTDDEAALEIANRTVHGVLHLGWVPTGDGGYRGQMAVLVKPNGIAGRGYMSAIAPFRHLLVYPAMLRGIARSWADRDVVQRVSQHATVSQDIRELSTLPAIDYADSFVVDTSAHPHRSALEWAVAVLEEAPAATRAQLLAGWSALGLIGADSDHAVLGWDVRYRRDDCVLLGRNSRLGMPGELLFALRPEGLLFATFVHHETIATRAMWAAVRRTHVRTVLELLERAAGYSAGGGGGDGSAGAGNGGAAGAGAARSPGATGRFGPGAMSG